MQGRKKVRKEGETERETKKANFPKDTLFTRVTQISDDIQNGAINLLDAELLHCNHPSIPISLAMQQVIEAISHLDKKTHYFLDGFYSLLVVVVLYTNSTLQHYFHKRGYTSLILVHNHVTAKRADEKGRKKKKKDRRKAPVVGPSRPADLLGLLLVAKSLLGTEGCNVGSDQDIKLLLQLGTVTKEEKDLPDNKVGSKNKSCKNIMKNEKKGFWVTNRWEIDN